MGHASIFGHELWQWIGLVLVGIAAYPVARLGSYLGVRFGQILARRTVPPLDDSLVHAARRPLRLVLWTLLFREGVETLDLSESMTKLVDHVNFTLLLTAFAWFALQALKVGAEWASTRGGSATNEVKTRAFRTQIALLRRLASVTVVMVVIAMGLLQFELVRSVGLSLLASAGIAGIVLGLAAQKTLGALISGVQLSVTQPIRIGDTVLVDKEWGEIQEINLTFVVVKLWDGRSQIVPISRFLDQPFENWTMPDPKLTGVVLLHVDFMTPIERLRPELERLCRASSLWDGRVAELRITDANESTMTIRATVSAADPAAASSLRLDVREGLITFLRKLDGGAYLPRRRVVGGEAGAEDVDAA